MSGLHGTATICAVDTVKEWSADLQKADVAPPAGTGGGEAVEEALLANEQHEIAQNIDPKRAEDQLAQLNRTLQTLCQCNQALVRATEERELLQSVCRILVEVGGLRMAWVGLRELDENKTVRTAASAGYDDGYAERLDTTWADVELGRGPSGRAIRTGRISLVQDILTEPSMAPWRAEALKRRYASSVALPLTSQGEAFGALALYAEEPYAFNASTIEQYADLANNLAYGVIALRTREEHERAVDALRERAEEKLRKRSEQVQKHRDVLLGLAHSDK